MVHREIRNLNRSGGAARPMAECRGFPPRQFRMSHQGTNGRGDRLAVTALAAAGLTLVIALGVASAAVEAQETRGRLPQGSASVAAPLPAPAPGRAVTGPAA